MSASPAPSTASEAPTKAQEQITFRFCRECSNMLYPKEDRMTSKLMFACRTCQFSEEAISSCVFRNNMYNTVGETAGVTQDVGSDPTVGDPSDISFCCTLCGQELEELDEERREGALVEVAEGKGMQITTFSLEEMSRMEEEEEEEEEDEEMEEADRRDEMEMEHESEEHGRG